MLRSFFASLGVSLADREGNQKAFCPKCHAGRKHRHDKSLSVNLGKGVWKCHHCGWTGRADDERGISERTYRPCLVVLEPLDDSLREYLSRRKISAATLDEWKVSQAVVNIGRRRVKAIAFPYYRGDRLVSVKYRTIDKEFLQETGCEPILFGESRIRADEPLYWVEGEIDALSLYEAGIKNVVSIPNGASDRSFDWLIGLDVLDRVEKHVFCFDCDAPGRAFGAVLATKLSRPVYEWTPNGKDANEILVRDGVEGLRAAVEQVRLLRLADVIQPIELLDGLLARYDAGGESPGWDSSSSLLTEHYRARRGEMTVLTGIPGSGKSRWLDWLLVDYVQRHGLRIAIWSPEIGKHRHVERLAALWLKKPIYGDEEFRASRTEYVSAIHELNERFVFLEPETPTTGALISAGLKAIDAGADGVLLDPYNEIILDGSRSEHESINNMLRDFQTKLVRRQGVHLWIVAHPRKLLKELSAAGKFELPVPTPYDISGSAHWYNRADACLAVHRTLNGTEVHVQKIRFDENGKLGVIRFAYERSTGFFYELARQEANTTEEKTPF